MQLLLRHAWLFVLFLGGLVLGDGAQERASAPVVAGQRVEQFVLVWPHSTAMPAGLGTASEALAEAARARQLGLVEIRRDSFSGSPQLEVEIDYPFENLQVLAVECLDPRSPRLVWREVSDGAGRTLMAEWTARNEELRVREWGIDGSLRETKQTRSGAVMPQYLLELIRSGAVTSGSFEVFAPLSHALEHWTLKTSYRRERAAATTYLRQAELRRDDGTLAGRYVYRGEDLLEFQWQEGGAVARRLAPAEFAELRARWGFPASAGSDPAPLGEGTGASPLDAAARNGDNPRSRVKDA
jgi:hypothetical protein